MTKLTKFKVHYKRETLEGEPVRGFIRVDAKSPEEADAIVRAEIPRVIILKTKVDKER